MNQHIQYCKAVDGVRIAYSVLGDGTHIVRASHWMSHLEYDLESPVMKHLLLGLSYRHSLVRYDARGTGLSDRDVSDISFERWVNDLEVVVDALQLEKFALLGISQGAGISIEYASRHPERITHLVLHGGYARGSLHRDDKEAGKKQLELSQKLILEGWGDNHDVYRQFFTSQFIPNGTTEQFRWFNEMEKNSASPEVASRMLAVTADVNVLNRLEHIAIPTLVTHCRGDIRVPVSESQELAAGITGAKFVLLESENHLFLSDEPAHRKFFEELALFLGDPPLKGKLPWVSNPKNISYFLHQIEQSSTYKLLVIAAVITGLISVIFAFVEG